MGIFRSAASAAQDLAHATAGQTPQAARIAPTPDDLRISLGRVILQRNKVRDKAEELARTTDQIETIVKLDGPQAAAIYLPRIDRLEGELRSLVSLHDEALLGHAKLTGEPLDPRVAGLIQQARAEAPGAPSLQALQVPSGPTALDLRVQELLDLPAPPRRLNIQTSAPAAPSIQVTAGPPSIAERFAPAAQTSPAAVISRYQEMLPGATSSGGGARAVPRVAAADGGRTLPSADGVGHNRTLPTVAPDPRAAARAAGVADPAAQRPAGPLAFLNEDLGKLSDERTEDEKIAAGLREIRSNPERATAGVTGISFVSPVDETQKVRRRF